MRLFARRVGPTKATGKLQKLSRTSTSQNFKSDEVTLDSEQSVMDFLKKEGIPTGKGNLKFSTPKEDDLPQSSYKEPRQ